MSNETVTPQKRLAVEFAYWIERNCIMNFEGYFIRPEKLTDKLDPTEYQLDELFDYWHENIYKP